MWRMAVNRYGTVNTLDRIAVFSETQRLMIRTRRERVKSQPVFLPGNVSNITSPRLG